MTSSMLDDLPTALSEVRTRPLFVMRLDVLPMLNIGDAHAGYRRVGVVPGGRFEGERLSGVVMPGGADWQTRREDGAIRLDVRLVLKTGDGTLIGMSYQGIRHGPPDVIEDLEAGRPVEPESYYFRIVPQFETSAGPYDWLNRIAAVGLGHRRPDGPVYSVFEVL